MLAARKVRLLHSELSGLPVFPDVVVADGELRTESEFRFVVEDRHAVELAEDNLPLIVAGVYSHPHPLAVARQLELPGAMDVGE